MDLDHLSKQMWMDGVRAVQADVPLSQKRIGKSGVGRSERLGLGGIMSGEGNSLCLVRDGR